MCSTHVPHLFINDTCNFLFVSRIINSLFFFSRGVHIIIFNDDADLKEKMLVACQRLNLAEHTVKGADDLIAKLLFYSFLHSIITPRLI